MIYPNNYEKKIGFDEIRKMLRGNCITSLGWELVGEMSFSTDAEYINRKLSETKEYRRLLEEEEDFCLQDFFDVRQYIARLKLKGTHLEEVELSEILRSLQTAHNIIKFFPPYPNLWLLAKDVNTYHDIVRRISAILDNYGHIKDNASSALFHIRTELRKHSSSISHTLNSILRTAQAEGLIDKDVAPTLRDGRLVLPVSPALRRRIPGVIHDESASGKTLFIEPATVVEANNKIRELEAEERREIIRILIEVSDFIRPYADGLLETVNFLAKIDFLQAKAQLASEFEAIEPNIGEKPSLIWHKAIHPLLRENLRKQNKSVIPLDIDLQSDNDNGTILIISGPNAGGKSVCLKTIGLLQYMLQCGISIPLSEDSKTGVFQDIMIDIGDEQSIEDDLSTYSSHLMNMKMMIKRAQNHTLLLIDEFGTGTEPQIGGAIAEAVLKQFWQKKTWGIITTHYQNLKHFADDHNNVINGAMLYDRHEMKALFQLQIGRPGSSFAIEIARKTGLPEEVIADATEIVGQDYIQSDKYLQDIVRDKRYWEQKRHSVHQREKDMERTITKFESSVEEIERERKAIIKRAKEQAKELLQEANKRIENTIREIREAEAEREATKRLRKEFAEFNEEVNEIDTKAKDAAIEKKIQQILARRERMAKRKVEKKAQQQEQASATSTNQSENKPPVFQLAGENDHVKIKGTSTSGIIESIDGKEATIIIGDIRTRISLSKLEKTNKPKEQPSALNASQVNKVNREIIDTHRAAFKQEIDVRGLRADDALLEVQHFIDDAILMGVSSVRILHGKGNGILRTLIRQYLNTIPNILSCKDEHVQFGGAGITVVEIG